MAELDLFQIADIASGLAREAGDILRDFQTRPFKQIEKSNESDIVTEADRAAEAVIMAGLQRHFPDHYLVGEESGGIGDSFEDAEYLWYIDPLDGTTNFANHIPVFSVSIALVNRQHEPLVGVVYAPLLNEMFLAIRGQGVTLNGQPIKVGEKQTPGPCVIASGFPYTKATSADNNLTEWGAMLVHVRDLRRFGSAALDLCYVASGRFDGYWEQLIKPWDFLAGVLCVQEAGGVTTNYDGQTGTDFYRGQRVVAANPVIHAQMLKIIQDARAALPE